jgi:DNA-binding SARP family transcriptional activator
MYRLSHQDGSFTQFGDSVVGKTPIGLVFVPEEGRLYGLFFNDDGEVARRFDIMSIDLPPIRKEEIDRAIAGLPARHAGHLWHWSWIVSVVGLLFVAGLTVVKKRRPRPTLTPAPVSIESPKVDQSGGILLFGEFQIDATAPHGQHIQLSPKIKELFLLILLSTRGPGSSKLTSEKMTAALWPESNPQDAKNVRGVSMNKLREVLAPVPEVNIVNEHRIWTIALNGGYRCDYWSYLDLRVRAGKDGRGLSEVEVETALMLIERGTLLGGVSYPWLDSIQATVLHDVVEFCRLIMASWTDNERILLRAATTLLIWDPIDEQAMKAAVRLLVNSGRRTEARQLFSTFHKEHERLFGSDSPVILPDILP